MREWIRKRWQILAGIAACIVLVTILAVSLSLLAAEFSDRGGFHSLAVSIGKEIKQIREEIDEE